MNKEEAALAVFNSIYVPVFVKTAAERGIPINTEEDLVRALETTAMLRSIEQSRSSGVIKAAHETLLSATGAPGSAPAVDASQLPRELNEALSVLSRPEKS